MSKAKQITLSQVTPKKMVAAGVGKDTKNAPVIVNVELPAQSQERAGKMYGEFTNRPVTVTITSGSDKLEVSGCVVGGFGTKSVTDIDVTPGMKFEIRMPPLDATTIGKLYVKHLNKSSKLLLVSEQQTLIDGADDPDVKKRGDE